MPFQQKNELHSFEVRLCATLSYAALIRTAIFCTQRLRYADSSSSSPQYSFTKAAAILPICPLISVTAFSTKNMENVLITVVRGIVKKVNSTIMPTVDHLILWNPIASVKLSPEKARNKSGCCLLLLLLLLLFLLFFLFFLLLLFYISEIFKINF